MPRRRPRKKSHLIPLGRLVEKVYPAPKQLAEARVFAWWSRSMPRRIVDRARPVFLRDGVLFVNTVSSVWAHELHHMAPDILARLRASAPEARVDALRFRVGPLPDLPRRARPRRDPVVRVDLEALPEALGRALARVSDDKLRAVIAQAATTSLTHQRRR